jgi:hypothetical protein
MNTLLLSNLNNELNNYNIEYLDIEKQIKSYSLKFIQIRNKQVEWGMKFPMFVPAFYLSMKDNNIVIPSQNSFWLYYLNLNKNWFNSRDLSAQVLNGLKARVYRTYPSLIRDLHFAKYLQNKISDSEIIYDMDLDIKDGIDLLVIKDNKINAINLFTDTRRAYKGRSKKVFRHKNYENVNYLELPVQFMGSNKVGEFFLYGNRELQQILREI